MATPRNALGAILCDRFYLDLPFFFGICQWTVLRPTLSPSLVYSPSRRPRRHKESQARTTVFMAALRGPSSRTKPASVNSSSISPVVNPPVGDMNARGFIDPSNRPTIILCSLLIPRLMNVSVGHIPCTYKWCKRPPVLGAVLWLPFLREVPSKRDQCARTVVTGCYNQNQLASDASCNENTEKTRVGEQRKIVRALHDL